MTAWFRDAIAEQPPPDQAAAVAVRSRAANVLRPAGALRRLDEIAEWVAAWQRDEAPRIARPAVLIFAADHGVADAAPVSAYPTSVTAAMMRAFRDGRSTINVFAGLTGAEVRAVDVGVGRPTGDIRFEAAMTPQRFDEVVEQAVTAVDALDTDLLVLGEIGIGNTTAAAALAGSLLGDDPSTWVGRGTGVDDAGWARKTAAIRDALFRSRGSAGDPLALLRVCGGADLAAMTGFCAQAAIRRTPLLLLRRTAP